MQNFERIGRIPALDGIRGLAISLVLWWHVISFTLGGLDSNHHPLLASILKFSRFAWSGVDLFFVLSGFLIGGILLDEVTSPSYFSTFYIRRAYRIVPLYLLVLSATLLTTAHSGIRRMGVLGYVTEFAYYLFFVQNIRMVATGSFGDMGLDVTWSLAVEEQFYLTLPALVRFTPRRILWRVLVVAVLSAPVLRILVTHFLHGNTLAAYVLMPCRADALCMGVLIALAVRDRTTWETIVARRKYLYMALALVSFVGLWMLLGKFQPGSMQMLGLEYSLLATIYSLLLLTTLIAPFFSKVFSFPPLRFMGTIAYGLYLFHSLVALVFRVVFLRLYPGSSGVLRFLVLCLAMAATVAIAAASWKFFEKPLVKRGHRYGYTPPLSSEHDPSAREFGACYSLPSETVHAPAPIHLKE
jgi:peptidoglycan/LPS O-acetylase OafA/YrhL